MTSYKGEDEENCALDGKEMGKGKKAQSKAKYIEEGKKKDLSKIKCFHCHEFGHYATKYPHKKRRKKN